MIRADMRELNPSRPNHPPQPVTITRDLAVVMGKCVQNIVQHLDTSHMMHNAFKLVRGVGEVSQSQTKKKRPPKVTVGAFCKLREPHGSKLGRSDGK